MSEITEVQTGSQRNVTPQVGKKYIIQPLNPKKLKNRDRECLLLGFVPVSESRPKEIVAKIRFCDNNRVGRADLGDLLPIDE